MCVMNKKIMKPVLVIAGASFLLTGCVVRERTVYSNGPAPAPAVDSSTEVDVTGPPPPPQEDTTVVVGVAPGPDYIWVGGYWGWGPGGWAWRHGYWGHPPYHGARWYGPRYVYRGGRHVYVHGYWR
jgi:hypothetical protein